LTALLAVLGLEMGFFIMGLPLRSNPSEPVVDPEDTVLDLDRVEKSSLDFGLFATPPPIKGVLVAHGLE
jgi:hypothetical protein